MAIGITPHPSEPRVWQPSGLKEAWELRRQLGPGSTYISGGSLLHTQWESSQAGIPKHLISLEAVSSLRGMHLTGTEATGIKLRIGSMARLAECRKQTECRLLAEAARLIAAPSIRNVGTLGGNVASGIGDTIPALLVNATTLGWFNGKEIVAEPLEAWLGARSADVAEDGERRILVEMVTEKTAAIGTESGLMQFYHKVGRREAFVPSLVTVAGTGWLSGEGTLCGLRLAAGGGTSTACRLSQTEAHLMGQPLTEKLMKLAHDAVQAEWNGFNDSFATAEYRRKAAANLIVSELWKLWKGSR